MTAPCRLFRKPCWASMTPSRQVLTQTQHTAYPLLQACKPEEGVSGNHLLQSKQEAFDLLQP